MSRFVGGSAYSMARDIGEGYFAVTERSFRGMSAAEMSQLGHEIDRYMRELRGAQSAKDDVTAIQARGRKLSRLTSAMTLLRGVQQRRR